MPRLPRSIPKKPGPYHPIAAAEPLLYRAPPPRIPNPGAPPPPSKAALTAERVARWRKPVWYLGSTLAFGIGVYATALIVSTTRAPCSHANHSPTTQKDVSAVYDDTASSFDAEVGTSEYLMGITKARKQLAKECKGNVLEVSAGTGRNLGYYKFTADGVRSLTLLDLSMQMVEQAKLKWEVLNKGQKRALGVPVRFVQGDAAGGMPLPPIVQSGKNGEVVVVAGESATKGYDTIIQTMGLCSCPSPVQLLKNLVGHLNMENPDARIFLLEHGRSYYQWVNRILDTQAPQHADQHGCWWNRDIGDIVEASGLEVVRERRRHFGTTWIYELKAKQGMLQSSKETVEGQVSQAITEVAPVNEEKTSVSSWLPKWS